jgi:hypothetical protein
MSFTLGIFDMAEKYGMVKCEFAGIRVENQKQVPLFRVELMDGRVFMGARYDICGEFMKIMEREIRESHGTATCYTEDNNATAAIVSKRGSVQGAKNA